VVVERGIKLPWERWSSMRNGVEFLAKKAYERDFAFGDLGLEEF